MNFMKRSLNSKCAIRVIHAILPAAAKLLAEEKKREKVHVKLELQCS